MNSGVYKIENLVNGNIYIGSAVNTRRRWSQHKSDLNRKKHPNPHLQSAWDYYGTDAFKFIIIEEVVADKKLLFEAEQWWYDALDPDYNIRDIVESNLGLKHTKEAKQKISDAQTGEKNHMYGKKASEETKKKMSEAKAGENHPLWGKHHTEEAKQKISKSHTRENLSEESKQNMSEAHSGEKSSSAKLTWEKVIEIRAKYIPRKYTMQMLAKEYRVNQTTIYYIISNKTWKIKEK